MPNKIIEFVRKKDYQLIEELGRGACGKTVLLYDDVINEKFVCKKYEPHYEEHKEVLFKNFIHEIKLLHLINHKNIVRVFNYYIYPDHLTGYILMEHIEGLDIESYLGNNPENFNEVFLQAIDGFSYLESNNILHRDIRPLNIMVAHDNTLKIIDFGFGKHIIDNKNFNKSISLNWWCEPPPEFKDEIYDYKTEVYFLGKLFEKIIMEQGIENFKYKSILSNMCLSDYQKRTESFFEIKKIILSDKFIEIEFSYDEKDAYRAFSNTLFGAISKIQQGTKYYDDIDKIQSNLELLYKKVMLEESISDSNLIIRCFVNGAHYFKKRFYIPVDQLKSFIQLLRSCSKEKRNIILSNLYTKLDAIERYEEMDDGFDDDIPF